MTIRTKVAGMYPALESAAQYTARLATTAISLAPFRFGHGLSSPSGARLRLDTT